MKVYVPNEPFEENMKMIWESIERLGVPTIVGVLRDGDIYCLEGSHRVALMHSIEEIPNFVLVREDHLFYFGYDNNYLVSEKNAPKWVKSDLDIQKASDVLYLYDCMKCYDFGEQYPNKIIFK